MVLVRFASLTSAMPDSALWIWRYGFGAVRFAHQRHAGFRAMVLVRFASLTSTLRDLM